MPIGVDYKRMKKLRIKDLNPQGRVELYHLSNEDFEFEVRTRGLDKTHDINKMGGFAEWGHTWLGVKVKRIYMRCGRERVLAHELLHFQEGHYHD